MAAYITPPSLDIKLSHTTAVRNDGTRLPAGSRSMSHHRFVLQQKYAEDESPRRIPVLIEAPLPLSALGDQSVSARSSCTRHSAVQIARKAVVVGVRYESQALLCRGGTSCSPQPKTQRNGILEINIPSLVGGLASSCCLSGQIYL